MPFAASETKKRLVENIVSLYSLQSLNYIIPLLVFPYLIRTLGPQKYGAIAFAQAFAQYIGMLTDYGFTFSATRAVAANPDDSPAISRLFVSVVFIQTALYLLGFGIMSVLVLTVPRMHEHQRLFFIAGIAIVGNLAMPGWLFQGMQKMRYISIVSGGARIISAILLFAFVHSPKDDALALIIQGAGSVLAGAIGLFIAIRLFHIRWLTPSAKEMKQAIRDGWHVFITTSAISLYTNTNVFLVGLLAGDQQAGYFSAADKIIRALQNLINPVSQSIYPHINRLAAKSQKAALEFVARSFRWIASCTLILSLSIFFLAPEIMGLLFGRHAGNSAIVLRWTAFLPFLIGVSNTLAIQTMWTFRMDKEVSRIVICSGVLNVVMAVPLIRLFLAPGAGMSVLFTEFAVTLMMAIVLFSKGINVLTGEMNVGEG